MQTLFIILLVVVWLWAAATIFSALALAAWQWWLCPRCGRAWNDWAEDIEPNAVARLTRSETLCPRCRREAR